jgi:phage/plasmid-like protein (TIGR03299 family)
MADKITNNMISYTAETPWHGKGFRVNPGSSPEEMLKAAGMDWSVAMRSLAVSCTIEENGVIKNSWCHAPMKNFKAVVREDTNEVFCVPTKRYQPVQNIEVVRFFADYCDAASCELQVVGALEGGKKVWALARVNADYRIGHGDDQLGYVMLATSHDGSLRTVAMGTAIYVVCWNTMSAALSRTGSLKTSKQDALFSLKHTSKFTDAMKHEAARTVSLVKEQQEATAEMASLFSKVSLDSAGRIEFVRRLIGGESVLEQIVSDSSLSLLEQIAQDEQNKKEKKPEETRLGKSIIDSILTSPGSDLPSRNNTLWGAVNGVTYHVDHERGRTQDSTLSGAWFGDGVRLKAQAVQVAYDMAGVRV